MQLIRRFAACSVLAERLEACLVRGAEINVAKYCALSNTLVRLALLLNIDRPTRSPTTLADYLRDEHEEITK